MSILNKEIIKFAKSWIKNPRRMGTFLPIPSRAGIRMMENMPTISEDGFILEIGSGSGALTEFIYNHDNLGNKLVCVEVNNELCSILHKKFPKATIYNESAANFHEYIPSDVINKIEVIISSIPFLTVGKNVTRGILDSCSRVLKPGNTLLHVSYTPFVPFSRYGMRKVSCQSVWGFPKCYVHHYQA